MQIPQPAKTNSDLKPTIVIAGLVRDAQRTFKKEYARINRLFESSANLVWIVVESDSKDQTAELLKSESLVRPNFYGISLGQLELTLPSRMARMAYCRNAYLEKISDLGLVGSNIYLLVLDLDGLNSQLSPLSIMKCIDNSEIDVHTANQNGPYYDISALRAGGWVERDCWQSYHKLIESGFDKDLAYKIAVRSKMIRIPRKADPILVESAFGGAALYKTTVLGNFRYDDAGGETGVQGICEHVGFHKKLSESGTSIAIAPWLINSGYNEHTAHLHPIRRAMQPLFSASRRAITGLFDADTAHRLYQQLKKRLPV